MVVQINNEESSELKKLLITTKNATSGTKATLPPVTNNNANPNASQPQTQMTPLYPVVQTTENIEPIVQNVVATVNLGTNLNLLSICIRTRNSEYNPKRFHGLIMRILNPKSTALIFGTGKMVCMGSKSEQDAHLSARKFARIIEKLGFPVRFVNFKIQNLVACIDMKFPIVLDDLKSNHGQFCTYEPELYAGLIYRMIAPRVVLLIYVNGKMVIMGAKSRSDLKEAFLNIYPILKSYKKS